MQVRLVDLRAQYLSIKDEIDAAIAHVHERGNYVMGEEVERFEEAWARYCGVKHCVAVSSGTDALYLVLKALRKLDRSAYLATCIIPVRTFVAAAEAATRAGYDFFLSDDMEKWNYAGPMWVFLPTNLYGAPSRFADKKIPGGSFVLEDACQSHGAKPYGDAAVYSFYPTKNLGAMGQAGAVVTKNNDLAALVRTLRVYGEEKRFEYHHVSGNYRMDELQAAVLNAKLPHLDRWNLRRRDAALLYRRHLVGIEDIELPEDFPKHVYHAFPIRTKRRDELARFLEERGIQTTVRYPVLLHLQPALGYLGYKEGDFPEAESWAREHLCLPIHEMMSDEAVGYVGESIKEWCHARDS